MSAKRIRNKDALFFLQILLPITRIDKSGIPGDPRMDFFSPMSNFTNGYATSEKKWGGDYGHDYKNCSESELVKWFGVLTRDCARGGSSGRLSM